jgi:hypothetical protein
MRKGGVDLEFFLFTTDLPLALDAERAGVNGIIVDWETRGKHLRQKNHALEINLDTPQDVDKLSKALKIPVIVRINPLSSQTYSEVKCAINNGAKIIMLPMASDIQEVKEFLNIVGRDAKTIIQVETPSLASQAANLTALDWDYVYIGLNDLMVASGKRSIWEAIFDGTAESICNQLRGRVYGFGGSTILGGGEPIINVLILQELLRLGGSISVMRRTFKKELLDRDFAVEMNSLKEFIKNCERRGPKAIEYDHEHFLKILKNYLYPSSPYSSQGQ